MPNEVGRLEEGGNEFPNHHSFLNDWASELGSMQVFAAGIAASAAYTARALEDHPRGHAFSTAELQH